MLIVLVVGFCKRRMTFVPVRLRWGGVQEGKKRVVVVVVKVVTVMMMEVRRGAVGRKYSKSPYPIATNKTKRIHKGAKIHSGRF